MSAVFKLLLPRSNPRFGNESGGLERLAGLFPGHFCAGKLVAFFINEREQFASGTDIALPNGFKEARDITHAGARESDRHFHRRGPEDVPSVSRTSHSS